jgi:hypothetical protein
MAGEPCLMPEPAAPFAVDPGTADIYGAAGLREYGVLPCEQVACATFLLAAGAWDYAGS